MPHSTTSVSQHSISHPVPEVFTAEVREAVKEGLADPSVEGAYIQALEKIADAAKHCWGDPASRQHADTLYNALTVVDWMTS